MDPAEPNAPDLAAVVKAALAAGLPHVVIGGFSVIAHGYVRATKDSDLLIPSGLEADAAAFRFLDSIDATRVTDGQRIRPQDVEGREHVRAHSRHGLIDLLRGGLEPLDFETVDKAASDVELFGQTIRVAGLESVVGFKRLADRPQDRGDLEELRAIYGDLPITVIPGLDDQT